MQGGHKQYCYYYSTSHCIVPVSLFISYALSVTFSTASYDKDISGANLQSSNDCVLMFLDSFMRELGRRQQAHALKSQVSAATNTSQ